MALSTKVLTLGSGRFAGGDVVYPVSTRSEWVKVHDDLEATADSAAELLRPLSTDSTTAHAFYCPYATRLLLRVKYPVAATVSTNPIVRLYGIWPGPGTAHDAPLADDGTFRVMRLDNVDNNAAGVTITISTGTDIRDTTYGYSDCPSLDGYDLKGAPMALVLVETAAATSASAAEVVLEAMALN